MFADGIVAQFSEHKDSMSIGYGTYPLTIGYWLGRIWAINEIHENHNDDGILKNILPQCSGYLIVSGIRINLIVLLGFFFLKIRDERTRNYYSTELIISH